MKNNYIKLSFNNTITRLAGYPFGKAVFEEQVANNVDYENTPIIIEFPDQIIKSASSFTQGFFEVLIEKFGYNSIGNQIIIKSKNKSLIESIKNNLI